VALAVHSQIANEPFSTLTSLHCPALKIFIRYLDQDICELGPRIDPPQQYLGISASGKGSFTRTLGQNEHAYARLHLIHVELDQSRCGCTPPLRITFAAGNRWQVARVGAVIPFDLSQSEPGIVCADAKKQGAVPGWGQFLTVALNFLIAGFCFWAIKEINKLKAEKSSLRLPRTDTRGDASHRNPGIC
jgi:hypothetical protein